MSVQENILEDAADVKPSGTREGFTVDKRHLKMLRGELTKVRCWITGFTAGRHSEGFNPGIPGEDSLRQTIQYIDMLLSNEAKS